MAPINNIASEVASTDLFMERYAWFDRINPYKDWDGYGDTDAYLANLSRRISNGGSVKGATSWAYKL